ncbi:hypothetical protein DU500_09150 [Haloplanus rubicundus]|uniref:Uncharacterized protein n=2 Tax=Haloplanus rubicundus TaxID=1547898 RepID=A0A345E308_9EURY|nr:hypothetical protein DU500_09150 [Haloplanus rubicundus]
MVGVPDSNVSEDFPIGEAQNASLRASEIEGSVMASEYANTLEVIVTMPDRARGYLDLNDTAALSGDRGIALVLRDNTHSQGREVALDAGAVRDALGHTPEQVYGTHENGEEWTANVEYEAGMLVFEVPHFSSNSVSFSGSVDVTGTFTDGSTVQYDINSLDSVSDFSVNVTGTTSTEWDNESIAMGPLDQSTSVSIAGTTDPSGPSANGQPTISITSQTNQTAAGEPAAYDGSLGEVYGNRSGTLVQSEVLFTNVDRTVEAIHLNYSTTPSSSDALVDVWVVKESPDETYGEGTKVADSWNPSTGVSQETINFDQSIDVSSNMTVEFVTQSASSDGYWEAAVTDNDAGQTAWTHGGEFPSSNTRFADAHLPGGASNVDVSADDGTSVSLGDVPEGSTETAEFPISTGATTFDVTGSGAANVTLHVKERTETVDPSVTINGETTAYSGTLSDGTTTSLSANDSWIQSGTNTVNISVGDGTLSGDAPAPVTDLNYTHDATDKQTVDYDAEKWSERYNVSKTFASDRSSASLTIPFDDDVAKIQSIETRTNGGAWSTVSSENYDFDGTTLTVDLGSVSAGDEVAVRTTGRKVNVINGGITVLEPTLMGERLDTKFEIDAWSANAYISLGNTPDGTRINYLYKESWDADEHATVTADGYHKLYAPGASAGSSARVSTIPVRANAKSGEVRISVTDPLVDEPKFEVAPGASTGDEIEFTFIDAKDDTSYALYSVTQDTTRDQGTANSPLTLTDDDSAETLQFQVDDSGTLDATGDGGGSFWDGGASGPVIPAMPVLNPGLVVVIVLGIIAGAIAYQQRRMRRPDVPERAIYRSPLVLLAVGVALFIGLLLISPETVTTWFTLVLAQPLSNALNAALPLAGVLGVLAAIGIVVYWWWTRRRAKAADASTPDTVLRINADEGDK